jgi:hypothetical protein
MVEDRKPELIPPQRWETDLKFLRIRVEDRAHWRLAPPDMSYAMARRWARETGVAEVLDIATGETLVRLPEPKSPWSIPE